VQQALTNLRQQAIDACHAWKQRQEDAAAAVASAAGATHETLEHQLKDNEAAEQRSVDDLHVVQDEVAAQEAKLAAATKHLEEVKMKYAAAKAIREASDQGKVRQYGMFDAYSGHYKSVHGGFNTVERTQLRHRL
jgi:chromosome segregation ATPase